MVKLFEFSLEIGQHVDCDVCQEDKTNLKLLNTVAIPCTCSATNGRALVLEQIRVPTLANAGLLYS